LAVFTPRIPGISIFLTAWLTAAVGAAKVTTSFLPAGRPRLRPDLGPGP